MGEPIVTANSQIICAHGAPVQISPTATRVKAGGALVVVQPDAMTPSGCPLTTPSNSPSPCTTITYTTAATRVLVERKPVLLQSSSAMGYGSLGAQGPPTVIVAEKRVQMS